MSNIRQYYEGSSKGIPVYTMADFEAKVNPYMAAEFARGKDKKKRKTRSDKGKSRKGAMIAGGVGAAGVGGTYGLYRRGVSQIQKGKISLGLKGITGSGSTSGGMLRLDKAGRRQEISSGLRELASGVGTSIRRGAGRVMGDIKQGAKAATDVDMYKNAGKAAMDRGRAGIQAAGNAANAFRKAPRESLASAAKAAGRGAKAFASGKGKYALAAGAGLSALGAIGYGAKKLADRSARKKYSGVKGKARMARDIATGKLKVKVRKKK